LGEGGVITVSVGCTILRCAPLAEITSSPAGPPPPGGKSGHNGKTWVVTIAGAAKVSPLRKASVESVRYDKKWRRFMANPHEIRGLLKQINQ
jgi:hypothetical protein